MSGKLVKGGGGTDETAGSTITCTSSAMIAVQAMFLEVPTTRAEPFLSSFAPLPLVLNVIVLSSWNSTVDPVPTVTVTPGVTLMKEPSLAAIEFLSAPVSSNSSTPTSTVIESMLVQMKSVCRLLALITPTAL